MEYKFNEMEKYEASSTPTSAELQKMHRSILSEMPEVPWRIFVGYYKAEKDSHCPRGQRGERNGAVYVPSKKGFSVSITHPDNNNLEYLLTDLAEVSQRFFKMGFNLEAALPIVQAAAKDAIKDYTTAVRYYDQERRILQNKIITTGKKLGEESKTFFFSENFWNKVADEASDYLQKPETGVTRVRMAEGMIVIDYTKESLENCAENLKVEKLLFIGEGATGIDCKGSDKCFEQVVWTANDRVELTPADSKADNPVHFVTELYGGIASQEALGWPFLEDHAHLMRVAGATEHYAKEFENLKRILDFKRVPAGVH